MQMTPIDIRNKEFSKGLRGYQCTEVEKYLESISKEFENYYKENFELKEKTEKMEAELAQYHKLESTLLNHDYRPANCRRSQAGCSTRG